MQEGSKELIIRQMSASHNIEQLTHSEMSTIKSNHTLNLILKYIPGVGTKIGSEQ